MIPIEGVLDLYDVEYDPTKDGNQKVNCPFHEDSIASASVNLGEGLFNCYGCDARGDAIKLLIDQKGMEFREAKRLAEELAGGTRREVSRKPDSRDSLLPSRSRTGRRGSGWKSPWARR